MNIKIKYEAPKGSRFKKGTYKSKSGKRFPIFIGIKCRNEQGMLFYSYDTNKWEVVEYNDLKPNTTSMDSVSDIKSVKAFIRYIKKHSKYLPSGVEFKLVSIFDNCDVIARVK